VSLSLKTLTESSTLWVTEQRVPKSQQTTDRQTDDRRTAHAIRRYA